MTRTGLFVVVLAALAVEVPLAGGTNLDSAAPAIESSTPRSPANENNPILNGTAEPDSLVFLYTDSICLTGIVGTAIADASGAFHIKVPVENNTATTFYAAAPAGACSAGFSYVEDSRAPGRPHVAGPPNPSGSSTAHFVFTSEPRARFLCRLDRSAGTFSPCSNPQVFTVGDGAHSLVVEAVDAAGNVGEPSPPYSWTVDTVPPQFADRSLPQNVTQLKRSIGYGVLRLRWKRPSDADFDHFRVFLSTSSSAPPRTLVYTGQRQSYTNTRYRNGLYHWYRVVSYDQADNASLGASAVVPMSALLRSPPNGGVVDSPPVLRWAGVTKATFYNVQVYYRGQKVLSAWPVRPRQALTPSWVYGGRSFSFRKGVYTWYVWPGFGPKAKSHYGQLLGQGTFRVR
jgi:hypothetical protein